jgi:hypothetical protein
VSDRIEEVEKELAESEAISAEVPGLRETYTKQFLGFPMKTTNGLYAASGELKSQLSSAEERAAEVVELRDE